MKVLFTGMASHHCSPSKNIGFFNTLAEVVSRSATVVWASPKLTWTKADLEAYDAIFLGFIPPTALGANKIYGAMHVLGLMFDSPKLNLIADSAQIWQYKNSIESVKRDVSSLFTPFYSKRLDYGKAREPKHIKSIVTAAEKMSSSIWPRVLFPILPWQSQASTFEKLGFGSSQNYLGLNLDSMLLKTSPYGLDRLPQWAADSTKSSWLKTVSETLRFSIVDTKPGRVSSDADALSVINVSSGLLLPPQDRGLGSWWSYRYVQGLNSGTPIVTYWQDTVGFDSSWSQLAYQVEDMHPSTRVGLAREQFESYQSTLLPKLELISYVNTEVLDSTKERI